MNHVWWILAFFLGTYCLNNSLDISCRKFCVLFVPLLLSCTLDIHDTHVLTWPHDDRGLVFVRRLSPCSPVLRPSEEYHFDGNACMYHGRTHISILLRRQGKCLAIHIHLISYTIQKYSTIIRLNHWNEKSPPTNLLVNPTFTWIRLDSLTSSSGSASNSIRTHVTHTLLRIINTLLSFFLEMNCLLLLPSYVWNRKIN